MSFQPHYSPLCDTDSAAYLSYLKTRAVCALSYGSGFGVVSGGHGSDRIAAGGNVGGDTVCSVVGDGCGVWGAEGVPAGILAATRYILGGDVDVCGGPGASNNVATGPVLGISGGVSGGVVGGLVDDLGNGADNSTADAFGSVLSAVAVSVDERKQMRKDKNKRRKVNRKLRRGGIGGSSCEQEAGSAKPGGERFAGSVGSEKGCLFRGSSLQAGSVLSGSGVARGFFSSIGEADRVGLQQSRAKMLVRQNELAMLRAERDMKVLQATDIELEKKRHEVAVRAATERGMVSIERTHARLAATDNVIRSDMDHDVHTVLTGDVPGLSSGSISPNSSASMAEFRACQKENLDLKAAFAKLGYSETTIPYIGKKEWTINSQGTLDDAAHAALDELMPGGYALDGQQYAEKGDKVGVMPLGQWGY